MPFSNINRDSLENRPRKKEPMAFCNESNWDQDVKCCMDGSSIEYVINKTDKQSKAKTPESMFLKQYPCVNGLELKKLALSSLGSPVVT